CRVASASGPLSGIGKTQGAVQAGDESIVQKEPKCLLRTGRAGHNRLGKAPWLEQIWLTEVVVKIVWLVTGCALTGVGLHKIAATELSELRGDIRFRAHKVFPRIPRQRTRRVIVGAALRRIDKQVQQSLRK